MSDFLIAVGLPLDIGEVTEALQRTKSSRGWSGGSSTAKWVLSRVDSPVLWAPATDSASGLTALVVGRFAFSEAEWLEAERLPFQGGLAARLVLRAWLTGNERAVEQLNGAGIAVIFDHVREQFHLWTDRMGFVPAFFWNEGGLLICSHPDVAASVLEAADRYISFDAETMAEFLRTGTATHPHTYWRGIRQLEPGHYFEISESRSTPRIVDTRQFWSPSLARTELITDRAEAVERLASALASSVAKRTLPRLGKVALMLSAGADSRTALFAACEPQKVDCITFYDEANEELRGAEALARAAGATHIPLRRSPEYYFEHAAHAVQVSGGMWSIESAHHGGVPGVLDGLQTGVLLTGCYADYLLKGITYDTEYRKIGSKTLPLVRLAEYNPEWHHHHFELSPPWQRAVDDRLEARYGYAKGGDQRARLEELRLSPIIREPDAAGRLFLRRLTPLDVFMSDNDVLNLSATMAPLLKLNGVPFGMAVSKIAGPKARGIFNNNYSAPVGTSEVGRVGYFVLGSLRRKLRLRRRRASESSIATAGSWPDFRRAIPASGLLADWFGSRRNDIDEFLFSILGEQRRGRSLSEWASREPVLFLRYFTASLWLQQNPRALRAPMAQLQSTRRGTGSERA